MPDLIEIEALAEMLKDDFIEIPSTCTQDVEDLIETITTSQQKQQQNPLTLNDNLQSHSQMLPELDHTHEAGFPPALECNDNLVASSQHDDSLGNEENIPQISIDSEKSPQTPHPSPDCFINHLDMDCLNDFCLFLLVT